MKPRLIAVLVVAVLATTSCSRKSPQAGPGAPEVLVTTVQPRDVPRILERVATLDGFINANINAQVSGYITSRDYKEGMRGSRMLHIKVRDSLLSYLKPGFFEKPQSRYKWLLYHDARSLDSGASRLRSG